MINPWNLVNSDRHQVTPETNTWNEVLVRWGSRFGGEPEQALKFLRRLGFGARPPGGARHFIYVLFLSRDTDLLPSSLRRTPSRSLPPRRGRTIVFFSTWSRSRFVPEPLKLSLQSAGSGAEGTYDWPGPAPRSSASSTSGTPPPRARQGLARRPRTVCS